VTVSLHNRTGHSDMPAVVGTFVFLQHWYWHSFSHFASLAFRPTCLIGLNKNLQVSHVYSTRELDKGFQKYLPNNDFRILRQSCFEGVI
jgi:26S proteasome regulatory subunit N2